MNWLFSNGAQSSESSGSSRVRSRSPQDAVEASPMKMRRVDSRVGNSERDQVEDENSPGSNMDVSPVNAVDQVSCVWTLHPLPLPLAPFTAAVPLPTIPLKGN